MEEEQHIALLEVIFNDANLAIFVVDVDENHDFRFASLNKTHEQLFGMRSSDIRGKRPEDLIPKITAEASTNIRQHYQNCLIAGKPIEYEEMIPFDNQETWWQTRLIPLKDENSRIYRLIGTSIPINSLKLTQQKLENTQKQLQTEIQQREEELKQLTKQHTQTAAILEAQWNQFKAVLESFSDVLYIVDIETYEILLVNKALTDLFGKKLVGKKCYEALQGFKEPCDFCTNDIIRQNKGKPYIWEYHNPIIHRDYYINDQLIKWPDGRDVRLEIAIDVTERKQAQIQYETIIKTALDGFMVLDLEGNILDANDAYVQMSGYPREKLLSMRIYDLETRDTKKEIQARAIEIVKSGYLRFESQHRRKDDSLIDVDISSTFVNEHGGRSYIFIRDITERKKAEDALRKSEAKFRLIAENVGDIIWQMSPSLKFTYVSPSIFEMSGNTPEEWVGSRLSDHATPEAFREMAGQAMRALKDFVTFNDVLFESRMLRKDGTEFPVEIRGRLIRNDKGLPIGLQGITRDITERKKRDEALRHAENRSKALIEHAPDGIVLVTVDGTFKFLSPSALRMFGYEANQSIEKGPNDLTHPEDLPRVLQAIAQIIENPKLVLTLQYRFLHNNGTWRWIESTFSNLLDEPAVEAIVINFRDITESREAALALAQNTKELKQSNLELEQFAYVASHDLQEPLRMISSYLQLIERRYKGQLDQEADEFIGYAVNGASRMKQLINDMLLFSRVGTRGRELVPVSSQAVLQEVMENLQLSIEDAKAQITVTTTSRRDGR